MTATWSTDTEKMVRVASNDPGSVTPRGWYPSEDDPDREPEALHRWQARAILLRLAEAGLLRPTCRHCGNVITKMRHGTWTHGDFTGLPDGHWEGVRCPGEMTGAEPIEVTDVD